MNDTLGSNTKGVHRLRFSLLNLVLVMTVVAMALVIYRQQGKIKGLTQTVADAGFLSVGDQSQYHAIYVPTYDELTWRWRVWLPEGNTYEFSALCNRIPPAGYPGPGDGRDIVYQGRMLYSEDGLGSQVEGYGPGEYVVTYAIRKNESTAGYDLTVRVEGGKWMGTSHPLSMNGDAPSWENDRRSATTVEGLESNRQRVESGEQLLLMKTQRYEDGELIPTLESAEKPGLMFWVQPIRKSNSAGTASSPAGSSAADGK